MNRKFIGSWKGRAALVALVCSTSHIAVAMEPRTDVGRSIAAMDGSNQFHINAGDAIRVTCGGLVALGAEARAEDDVANTLFGHCNDMVAQAFFIEDQSAGGPPAADRFGIGASSQDYFALLRQFSGEEVSSQGRAATEGNQYSGLAGRLAAINAGARTSGIAFNMNGVDVINVASDGDGEALVGGAAGDAGDTGWGWFLNFDYGFGDRDDSGFENGYDVDSYAGTFGLDYGFSNGVVLGAAIEVQRAEVDFDSAVQGGTTAVSGGDFDDESETLSVFLTYGTDSWYLNGIVSFGDGEYDLERTLVVPGAPGGPGISPAQNGVLESSTDTETLSAQGIVGYIFGEGATTFDLYGGYDYYDLEIDGFAETGAASVLPLALEYGDQDVESEQLLLGGTLRRAVNLENSVLVPYLTVEYRHELENETRNITARYRFSPVTDGSDNFFLPTDDADDDYFEVRAGFSAQFANSLVFFMQYNGVFALEDTTSNLITLGLRGTF